MMPRSIATQATATSPIAASRLEVADKAQRRIFVATIDARLIALDAATGKPCADFGDNGAVDLAHGTAHSAERFCRLPGDLAARRRRQHDHRRIRASPTTASTTDAQRRSARLRRRHRQAQMDLGSDPAGPKAIGADTWKTGRRRTGAANAWSIIVADPERNLVFIPTGAPARITTAASARATTSTPTRSWRCAPSTGELRLAASDGASRPVGLRRAPPAGAGRRSPEGRPEHACGRIVATKTGLCSPSIARPASPSFGVEERPVPQGATSRAKCRAPTQPFPVAPPPLVSHAPVRPEDAWGLILWDKWRCRKLIERYRSEGIYTPPSLEGTIIVPGYRRRHGLGRPGLRSRAEAC